MTALTGAARFVKTEIANLESTASYAWDKMTQEDFGSSQKGDTISILSLSDFTVNADADSTSITPDTPSQSAISITIDSHPGMVVHLKKRESAQIMGGGGAWARGIAEKAVRQMRNYIDQKLFDYFQSILGETGTPQYTVNIAGAAVTQKFIDTCDAMIMDAGGVSREKLAWFMSPYMIAACRTLATWATAPQQAAGNLGLSTVGFLNGIPVYQSANLPGAGIAGATTAATTVVVISTNVATITAADHDLLVGEKITVTGTTEELTTAAAIASVADANTLTVAFTASNANPMADSAGTITSTVTRNFLVNTDHVHVSMEPLTDVEIVKREASAGHNLILDRLYGMIAQAAPYSMVGIHNYRGTIA